MNTHKILYRPDGGEGDAYVILIYFNHEGEEFTSPVMKYQWPSMIDIIFLDIPNKPTPIYPCEKDDDQRLRDQEYIDITYMQGSIPAKLKEWIDKKLDEHYDKFNERHKSN